MDIPRDVMRIILNDLPYESLVNLCNSASYFRMYCDDKEWKLRVREDFPFWYRYKPLGGMSYYEYYTELYSQYYVVSGSEKFIDASVYVIRAIFRNSRRLIQRGETLYNHKLRSDREIPYLYERYTSPPLIDEYFKDMKYWDYHAVECRILGFIASGRATPELIDITPVKTMPKLVTLKYGRMEATTDKHNVEIALGTGGNWELISSYTKYVARGAADVDDSELYFESCEKNVDVVPPSWAILDCIAEHKTDIRNMPQPFGPDTREEVFSNGMTYIVKQLTTRINQDPNYIIDVDESYQKLLLHYGDVYRRYNIIDMVIDNKMTFTPVQGVSTIEFYSTSITITQLVILLEHSRQPITLARYMIEKKLMHPTEILSCIAIIYKNDNARIGPNIPMEYMTSWLRKIQEDYTDRPLLGLDTNIHGEYTYTMNGKTNRGRTLKYHINTDFNESLIAVYDVGDYVITTTDKTSVNIEKYDTFTFTFNDVNEEHRLMYFNTVKDLNYMLGGVGYTYTEGYRILGLDDIITPGMHIYVTAPEESSSDSSDDN